MFTTTSGEYYIDLKSLYHMRIVSINMIIHITMKSLRKFALNIELVMKIKIVMKIRLVMKRKIVVI